MAPWLLHKLVVSFTDFLDRWILLTRCCKPDMKISAINFQALGQISNLDSCFPSGVESLQNLCPGGRQAIKELASIKTQLPNFIFVNNRLEGNALGTIAGVL
jgi:hypothetical protein